MALAGAAARFTPRLDDHVFSPPAWKGTATGRVADADFVDTLQRTLELRLYGGQCSERKGLGSADQGP